MLPVELLRQAYAAHLAAGVAQQCSVAGSPVTGQFSAGYAEAFDVAGTQPSLRCIAEDVPGVARGNAVTIGSDEYTVANVLPTSRTGEVMLILEAA